MKKLNKKGFTIVELVIVIAVIAILAAVLIPTFANVSEKANESAAMQAAKNEYTNYLAVDEKHITGGDFIIVSGDYVFVVEDGSFVADGKKFEKTAENTYTATVKTGKATANDTTWTVTKSGTPAVSGNASYKVEAVAGPNYTYTAKNVTIYTITYPAA